MTTIQILNTALAAIFLLCYAYQFAYIPIALLKKRSALPEAAPHRFAVLIAARNEEAVIGDLLDSLHAQQYPADHLAVYVVADNCTDATADVARAHGAKVVERHDRSRVGKGFALSYLLRRIHKDYDAYLVFDADNLVAPDYMREMNKTFSAGYDIVTSYRNSKNYGDNWISAGYGLWFLREAQYLNRPRALLGVSCGVSGTGFLFSRRILERCGGWNFFCLTEDIEFTAHSIVHGEMIGYCPTAVFYDEQPTGFRQSIRQRTRWVQGYLQVLRRYGSRLVRGSLRSFSCFDMLMNIAPAAILTWAGLLCNLGAIFLRLLSGVSPVTVLPDLGRLILGLCGTVLLLGAVTTATEWKRIRCSAGRKLLYILTFPLFMLTYLPATVAAIVCRPGWKPIEHKRVLSVQELAGSAEEG